MSRNTPRNGKRGEAEGLAKESKRARETLGFCGATIMTVSEYVLLS